MTERNTKVYTVISTLNMSTESFVCQPACMVFKGSESNREFDNGTKKAKVNLSFHCVNACGVSGGTDPVILAVATRWTCLVSFMSSYFTSGRSAFGTHWAGDLVGPRVSLDVSEEGNPFVHANNRILNCPVLAKALCRMQQPHS
jgi:hypothetical protein